MKNHKSLLIGLFAAFIGAHSPLHADSISIYDLSKSPELKELSFHGVAGQVSGYGDGSGYTVVVLALGEGGEGKFYSAPVDGNGLYVLEIPDISPSHISVSLKNNGKTVSGPITLPNGENGVGLDWGVIRGDSDTAIFNAPLNKTVAASLTGSQVGLKSNRASIEKINTDENGQTKLIFKGRNNLSDREMTTLANNLFSKQNSDDAKMLIKGEIEDHDIVANGNEVNQLLSERVSWVKNGKRGVLVTDVIKIPSDETENLLKRAANPVSLLALSPSSPSTPPSYSAPLAGGTGYYYKWSDFAIELAIINGYIVQISTHAPDGEDVALISMKEMDRRMTKVTRFLN